MRAAAFAPPHHPVGAEHNERIGQPFDDALLRLQQPLHQPRPFAERLGEELHLAHHLRGQGERPGHGTAVAGAGAVKKFGEHTQIIRP